MRVDRKERERKKAERIYGTKKLHTRSLVVLWTLLSNVFSPCLYGFSEVFCINKILDQINTNSFLFCFYPTNENVISLLFISLTSSGCVIQTMVFICTGSFGRCVFVCVCVCMCVSGSRKCEGKLIYFVFSTEFSLILLINLFAGWTCFQFVAQNVWTTSKSLIYLSKKEVFNFTSHHSQGPQSVFQTYVRCSFGWERKRKFP